MANTLDIIIRAVDKYSSQFSKIRSELKKTEEGTKKVSKAVAAQQKVEEARQKALAKSYRLVGNLAIAAGVAATTALGLAARSAIKFEDEFAGVKKTVNLGEIAMDGLARSIRDMATEMPVSTTELSKIAEIAGQLGIQTVPELEKFTRVMAKASTAITEVGVEQMSLSFAQIANVMGEPIDNIDRMASVVVELGNKMKTGEQKIFNYSKRLAPVASIVGMTTDQLFGLSAGLASTGIEAEAGSTAVQKAMLFMRQSASGATSTFIDNTKEIGKNTDKLGSLKDKLAVATLKQKEFTDSTKESTKLKVSQDIAKYTAEIGGLDGALGILNETNGQMVASQSDFAEIIGVTKEEFAKMREEDPAGTFVKFLEGLKRLEEEGGDAAKVLDDLGLGSARSLKTLLASANTAEEIAKGLSLASAEMESNSALNTEYGKRLETTASQMKIFKQNVNEVGISLGFALLPAINKMIQAMVPFIQSFARFSEEHPKAVVGILSLVVALGSFVTVIRAATAVSAAFKVVAIATGFKTVGAMAAAAATAIGSVVAFFAGLVAVVGGVLLVMDQVAMWLGITTDRFQLLEIFVSSAKIMWEGWTGILGDFITKLTGVSGATGDLQVAEENLNAARGAKMNLERDMKRQILNLEGARERLRAKTEEVRTVEEEYGKDSPQYEKAVRERELLQLDMMDQLDRTNTSIDNYNKNEQVIIDQKDAQAKALEQKNKDLQKHTEFWNKVGDAVRGAIDSVKNFFTVESWTKDLKADNPYFTESRAHGGFVSGPIDAPVPTILHGGERVIPRTGMDAQGGGSSGGTGGISISFNGPVNMDSEDRVTQLANMIEERLGRQNELARYGVGF